MVNKTQIRDRIRQYLIMDGRYEIQDDGSVVSYGNVYSRVLPKLPVKFAKISGDLGVSGSMFSSWENCPPEVGGNLWAQNTQVASLEGMPQKIGANISLENTKITSLVGLATEIGGWIEIDYSPTMPLLRLLAAKSGAILRTAEGASVDILMKRGAAERLILRYAGQGRDGAFDCRREMRAVGLEENARW